MLSASHLLATYGTVGIGVILFLETGLLIGIVLPGETLTVIAGAYSHGGGPSATHPSLALVMVAAGCGAVAGGHMGFLLGRRAGPHLFDRPDGLLFRRRYLERTRQYFRRFGTRAIVIGRFVPFIRTFVSPAAGVSGMPMSSFVPFNLLGGFAWAIVVATVGYVVGGLVSIDRYAIVVVLGIAAVSLIPLVLEMRAMRTGRRT
jgi:membrane-associated protein